jgi:hypothetical protein
VNGRGKFVAVSGRKVAVNGLKVAVEIPSLCDKLLGNVEQKRENFFLLRLSRNNCPSKTVFNRHMQILCSLSCSMLIFFIRRHFVRDVLLQIGFIPETSFCCRCCQAKASCAL